MQKTDKEIEIYYNTKQSLHISKIEPHIECPERIAYILEFLRTNN